jgi:hypothetical protein
MKTPLSHTLEPLEVITPAGSTVKGQISPWFPSHYPTPSGALRHSLPLFSRATCGVYLIRNQYTGQIVYVGHSRSNLDKTAYRHFQSWDDPTQYRASYPSGKGFDMRVILVPCQYAALIEAHYIQKYVPEDNDKKYTPGEWAGYFGKRKVTDSPSMKQGDTVTIYDMVTAFPEEVAPF